MEDKVDDVLLEINDVLLRRKAMHEAALREQRKVLEAEHLAALEALRLELEARRDKLEKSLALQIDGLHARVDEAEALRREAEDKAARLQGEVNELSEARTLLESKGASLEDMVRQLQAALAGLETETLELRESHSALTLQNEGLTAQLEASDGRLAGAAEAMGAAYKSFMRGLGYLNDEAPPAEA